MAIVDPFLKRTVGGTDSGTNPGFPLPPKKRVDHPGHVATGILISAKKWLVIVPAAVITVFWLGYTSRPARTGEPRSGQTPANTRQHTTVRSGPENAPRFRKPRPAVSGRLANGGSVEPPFKPGGSRDWLILEAKRAGWKDDPSTLYRMIQHYSSMDEASVNELVGTILESQRLRNAGDPETLVSFPTHEFLVKFSLFPALFRLSQLNPQEALDVIESDGDLMESGAFQIAIANFTNLDPDQALARAKSLEGPARRNAMEAVLGTLFATDSERVIKILEDFPQQEFDGERRKVVERLVAENPRRALDYAVGLVRAGCDASVLRNALGKWMQAEPEAATNWLDAYTGPEAESLKSADHP